MKITPLLTGLYVNPELPWSLRGAIAELLAIFVNESHDCCTQVMSYADIFSMTTEQLKAASSAITNGTLPFADVDITSYLRCLCGVLRWMSMDRYCEAAVQGDLLRQIPPHVIAYNKLVSLFSESSAVVLHFLTHSGEDTTCAEEALWCLVYVSAKMPDAAIFAMNSPLWASVVNLIQVFRTTYPAHLVPVIILVARVLSNLCGGEFVRVYRYLRSCGVTNTSRVTDRRTRVEPLLQHIASDRRGHFHALLGELRVGRDAIKAFATGKCGGALCLTVRRVLTVLLPPPQQSLWRLWVSVLEEFELQQRRLSATADQEAQVLLGLQTTIASCFGGDLVALQLRVTELIGQHSRDTILRKSAEHLLCVVVMVLHRLVEPLSFLQHGELFSTVTLMRNQLRQWLVGTPNPPSLLGSFLRTIKDKTADEESLFFILRLSMFVYEESEARQRIVREIIHSDLAEDIENAQYSCSNEEVADMAGQLLDVVYAAMEEENF